MAKLLFSLALAFAGALVPMPAQENPLGVPEPFRAPSVHVGPLSGKSSQSPAFSIPVEPLGFAAPGQLYLGQRSSLVSLDFLDENRLLFTFRVPGLIHRAAQERDGGEYEERQIRAVLLALPAGTVEAEALWTVHDRARYLWMLNDGRLLLRDRNQLEVGDASLELKPFLRFSGPLLWLEMDPAQQFLVTDSREPAGAAQKPDEVPNHAVAEGMAMDAQTTGDADLMVRILRRDTGQVLLVSRARSIVHLPINADGYLENQRYRGEGWLMNLKYYSGGSRIFAVVESACPPLYDFLSQQAVLVTACATNGSGELVMVTTDGRRPWETPTSDATIWPLIVKAPDGSRLARESLALTHAVIPGASVDPSEIKWQSVQVFNVADGKVALETSASPILDAGGNVAISPSGRRVAVLNAGAIQVFDLPSPPPLPAAPNR
jgi:hypothetical protein